MMGMRRWVEYALRNLWIGWWNKPHHSCDVKFHCHLLYMGLSFPSQTFLCHYFNFQDQPAEHQRSKKWLSVGNGTNFYGCLKFYITHKVLINLRSHETNHKVAITHLNIWLSFLGCWDLSLAATWCVNSSNAQIGWL